MLLSILVDPHRGVDVVVLVMIFILIMCVFMTDVILTIQVHSWADLVCILAIKLSQLRQLVCRLNCS